MNSQGIILEVVKAAIKLGVRYLKGGGTFNRIEGCIVPGATWEAVQKICHRNGYDPSTRFSEELRELYFDTAKETVRRVDKLERSMVVAKAGRSQS